MAIRNKKELIDYIKRQLGYPVINIEIAQEQIEDIINDATDLFHEYHADALKLKWKPVNLIIGTQDYVMDADVFSIVDIFGENTRSLVSFDNEDQGMMMKSAFIGNNGLFDDEYSTVDIEVMRQKYSMYQASVRREYLFDYSHLEHNLKMLIDIERNETINVLCQCYLDSRDSNYSSLWFREYCVALCGLRWAGNIGKYGNVSLPGGGSYNYADIQNKYDALRIELEEKIIDRYSSSFGIEVG